MRHVLIVAPYNRRGYIGSAILQAKASGEIPIAARGETDRAFKDACVRLFPEVDAVVVYDDLPLNEAIFSVISEALHYDLSVEYRQLPPEKLSVLDRTLIQA